MPDDAAAARAAAAAGGAGSGASSGDGAGGTGRREPANGQDAAALAAANARAAAAGGGGGGGGGGDGAAAGPWGATWREVVGDDKTKKGVLERYGSPKDFVDAHFALRQRLDSGELRAKLPDNASPEQVTAYRKENGIPEKAEDYFTGLKPEVVADITDGDRSLLTPYLKFAHEHNIPPTLLHGFIELRQAEQNRQVEEMVANDLKLKQTTEDALRSEWGKDYRTNIGVIHSLLDSAPEDLKDAILNARTPDGQPLLGTVEANRWFAQLARNLVDVGAIIPAAAGGEEGGKAMESRLKELQGWMGAPRGSAEYKKYWDDPGVQAEYRELLDRQANINRRRAA